jgi:hypothetical protein
MKPIVSCLAGAIACATLAVHAQQPQQSTTQPNQPMTLPNKLSVIEMKKLRDELPAAIRRTLAGLTPAVKTRIEKSLKAKPFPHQDKLLIGIWHGVSADPSYKSHWMYERRADGTMRINGIDLNSDDRQYSTFGFDIAWQAQGRVIFELKASERDSVDIFLINSIDADSIAYTIVFADQPADEWSDELDRRGPKQLPKPPIGWSKESE